MRSAAAGMILTTGEEALERRGVDSSLTKLSRSLGSWGEPFDDKAIGFRAFADASGGLWSYRFRRVLEAREHGQMSSTLPRSRDVANRSRKRRLLACSRAASALMIGSTAFRPSKTYRILARSAAMVSGVVKRPPESCFMPSTERNSPAFWRLSNSARMLPYEASPMPRRSASRRIVRSSATASRSKMLSRANVTASLAEVARCGCSCLLSTLSRAAATTCCG